MNHIKFAGLASQWNLEYAKAYVEKLFEMGFYAKGFPLDDFYVVAYSPRPFTRVEWEQALLAILPQNDEGEAAQDPE